MNDEVAARYVALHELVAAARTRLNHIAWDYLVGGGGSETTLRRNRLALDSLAFRPRVLRDVSRVGAGAEVFGKPIAMPVALAPVGSVESFDPGGLGVAARAAQAANVPIICSGVSAAALDDVAQGTTGPKVYQAYLTGDDRRLPDLIARTREAGFDAFCITVDTAHPSRRERDIANRYVKPYMRSAAEPRPTLSWDDVKRFKDATSMPLVLKGIATAEDAALAVEHGVDVVYVSNHGGRQLDHGRGAIEVLPEVVQAVQGRAKVWFDGGVSRGSDVVKALILGADLVGIGRLWLYGLAAAGQAGVERVLDLLGQEVTEALGLLGVTSLSQLEPGHLTAGVAVARPHVHSAFPLLDTMTGAAETRLEAQPGPAAR
ncbi:MAG: alpha-hydroxy acid oxidase [Phenylobacterium sp.]